MIQRTILILHNNKLLKDRKLFVLWKWLHSIHFFSDSECSLFLSWSHFIKWSTVYSLWFNDKLSKTGVKNYCCSQVIFNFHSYQLNGFFVIPLEIRRWQMQLIVEIRNTVAVFSQWKWWWRLVVCILILVLIKNNGVKDIFFLGKWK